MRLRTDSDAAQRARLMRFLSNERIGVTDLQAGRVWIPLSELSLEGLEAVAIEEVRQFRKEWRFRTEHRARAAA